MTHVMRLSLLLAWPLLFTVARAEPNARPVISAANANQVRLVAEVNRRVDGMVLIPGRAELAFVDWSKSIEIVDGTSFRPLRRIAENAKPDHFTVSPDGKLFGWHDNRSDDYVIEDAVTGKITKFKAGVSIWRGAFSPDGKLIAIGDTVVTAHDGHGGGYSQMHIYDVTGKLVRTLEASKQGGLTPVFSPDGKLIAVGNRNYETRIFEVATGKLLHTLDRTMTQEIAFSPDGKKLACGYVDGTIGIWDVPTGQLLHRAATGANETYSVDWSPKGDVLATSGHNGKIILWDPMNLTMLKELDAPRWVIQVRFTADGTRLLSTGSSDNTARENRKVEVWGVGEK